MDNSTKEAQMELAIADLDRQLKPNYARTAKEYGLVASTLRRRHQGLTMSKENAKSEYWQKLTNAQEEVLIERINWLTDRALPPTPTIVHNLAEEIIHGPIGKNWVAEFVKRHQDKLKSIYLRTIDQQRVQSEYAPSYQLCYDLVTYLHSYIGWQIANICLV